MKFHCDRCKTRYSIADERVRGKILKIRCKNCEAVITVREGMDSSGGAGSGKGAAIGSPRSPATPSSSKGPRSGSPSGPRPTLEKAFKRAMSSSGASPAPPPSGGFDDDATVINDDPSAAIAEARLAAERQSASPGTQRTPPPMPEGAGFARPRTEPPAPAPGASPSNAPPDALPDHLEEEWYVSIDGEQEGPFSLAEAKRWVSAQRPGEELYCWSEGFDDWLPVDKVSHFRPLRPPTVDPRAPTAMATAGQRAAVPGRQGQDDGPKPLFAATAAALDSDQPEGQPESSDPFAAALPGPKNGELRNSVDYGDFDGTADDDDFDFDVGEASRVVQMPMLLDAMRDREAPAPAPGRSDAGLPGMDDDDSPSPAGSGGFATVRKVTGGMPTVVPLGDQSDVGGEALLQPEPRARRGVPLWALLASAGTIVAVGIILLAVNMGDDGAGDLRIRRSRLGNESLGHSLEPRQRAAGGGPSEEAEQSTSSRPAARATRPRNARTPASGSSRSVATNERPAPAYDPFAKTDVTDFNADDPSNPLSADEIMKVYRENRLGIQWCYEQALKKDPLLDIAKVYVFITVAPSGSVTSVKLSSASATPLGQCLKTRIRRWRFRKSPDEFSSKFPLVFQN